MITSLTLNLYVILTYFITAYFFYTKYTTEKHFFALALTFVKSKSYLILIVNFALANYMLIAKSIIKLFFGEIRLSELFGVVDKLKAKIVSFMLLFLTMRPSIDTYKVLIILHVFFVLTLNMIAFNRAAYVMTAEGSNPNAKKEQKKIFFIHFCLFFINFLSLDFLSKPLVNMGIDFLSANVFDFSGMENGNPSEIIVYCIFTIEIIFIQIKLFVKFIKLSIELTEIKLQKEWEYKKPALLSINFIRYLVKLFIEIKFCGLTVKSGIFPIYLFIDGVYSIWHVINQGLKLYEFLMYRKLINKLDIYDSVNNENDAKETHQCICLDEVKVGKKLPCGHVFHESCIK